MDDQFVYGRPSYLDVECANCGKICGNHKGHGGNCPSEVEGEYLQSLFLPKQTPEQREAALWKDFYNSVVVYKERRKQLGGAKQIADAWHNVELQLQKLKPLIS